MPFPFFKEQRRQEKRFRVEAVLEGLTRILTLLKRPALSATLFGGVSSAAEPGCLPVLAVMLIRLPASPYPYNFRDCLRSSRGLPCSLPSSVREDERGDRAGKAFEFVFLDRTLVPLRGHRGRMCVSTLQR